MTLETYPRWVSCKDTAKAVRRAIKTQWPRVKFSVRSSVYSGGASIDVRWTDGPAGRRLRAGVIPSQRNQGSQSRRGEAQPR